MKKGIKKKIRPKKKQRIIKKNSFKLGKLNIPLHKRLGYNSKAWAALRAHCEKRDGGKKCFKRNKDCYGAMHLHHKKPLKNGGTNRPGNLAWVCHLHHCMIHPFMIKILIQNDQRRRL
jgi:5-methylcytosine-specific restriction endonuclease McrA